jgi:glycosyltransferase involved in cell wall biosynthesis
VESRPRIVLIGNYLPDAQESMQRFAHVMFTGLQRSGCHVEWLVPPVVFGRWGKSTTAGVGKWLGYVDKYVIFPYRLSRALRRRELNSDGPVVVHICDHSNAVYTSWTRRVSTVVTCHDLLAVRGAMGEPTDCPASMMGRQLQRWIVRGLKRASAIVSVSRATLRDVEKIVGSASEGKRRCLVHMGLNHGYRQLEPHVAKERLAQVPVPKSPFILHVGSNLRRKNRDGLLRILARVAARWNGSLVFAGEPLGEELWALARGLGIAERVTVISKPDTLLLEALYNDAMALVFPSRFEGFGWPIIEAQASGCPVICSNAGPLPEIVGEGGIICPVDDEEAFASAILRIAGSGERDSCVRRGLANVAEFTTERMIEGYQAVYAGLGVPK